MFLLMGSIFVGFSGCAGGEDAGEGTPFAGEGEMAGGSPAEKPPLFPPLPEYGQHRLHGPCQNG